MTFSSKFVELLARTVKVDFCLLLRETMPSQRADVWAKAKMGGKRTSIAASNNVMRCFTMESAPLLIRDFLFELKNGENCTPVFPVFGCSEANPPCPAISGGVSGRGTGGRRKCSRDCQREEFRDEL